MFWHKDDGYTWDYILLTREEDHLRRDCGRDSDYEALSELNCIQKKAVMTHNKDLEDVVIDDDRGLEEERTWNGQTLWDINQIVATMPVVMNSAKKETVIELLEYLIRLSKMQLAE